MTALERLGHAFASVITGNLILLGVGAVSRGGSQALFSGCALAATAVILNAEAWLPALQLVPLMIVLIGSRRLIGRPAVSEAAARR